MNRPNTASLCVFGSLAVFVGIWTVFILSVVGEDTMGFLGLAIAFMFVISGLAVVGLINIPAALHLLVVGMRQPKE